MPLGVAALVVGALVQAHEAAAGQPLPIAEAHPVQGEHRGLRAVQAPRGWARHQRRRLELRHLCIMDVGGAHVLVDVAALVHGAFEPVRTHAQRVADAASGETAAQLGTEFQVAARIVRAAVIVDVVVAVRREVVARHAAVRTAGSVIAAVGEGDVVVDHRAAVAGRHARLPVRTEIEGMQRGQVGAVDADRPLPGLVAEQVLAVHAARQPGGAQQLIARGRALRAGLVVGVHFELATLADQPIGGQRVEVAAAIGMVDVGIAVFPGRIEAHPETGRQPMAEIHRGVARAFRIRAEGDVADLGRALAHVVDDPTRGHDAGGEAGLALEDLHRLDVLQRQALFAGDGQPVEAVAGAGVQREAADRDVLVVADRRVAVAQRGIVAGQLGQRAHLAAVQQIAIEHVHRGRRALPVTGTEAAGLRGCSCRLMRLHAHGGQFRRRALGRLGEFIGMKGQRGAQGGGQQRRAEAAVHSIRHQLGETKRRRARAPTHHGGMPAAQSSLRRCKPDQVPRDSLSLVSPGTPASVTISLQTVRICEPALRRPRAAPSAGPAPPRC